MEGTDLFAQANQHHLEGRLDEAEYLYDTVMTQNPDHPGLLASMGTLYLAKHKYGLAMSLLERALTRSKTRPSDILSNLAMTYKYSGQYDKAMKLFQESCEGETTPEALTNYGSMFIESDNQDKGMEILERALDGKPDFALAHWNLSIMRLGMGMWDKAWEAYEYGFVCKQRIDRNIADKPRWDGKSPGTVCVYGEQGIGDEIMFASMLPDLMRTNTVIFDCHRRLTTLFRNSFPGLTVYGTREEKELPWLADHQIDYQISIGSLGQFYRRSRDHFDGHPYLRAQPSEFPRKFRVGISWTGGQKAGRIQKRTVPLSWWGSILQQDCEFVSLQYTSCEDEIALVERNGYTIKQYDEVKAEDYNETARLVASCDLVITVCTSVVHLAGALGVPCWVMTPKNPAWRYQNTGGCPWYRSVRLYRQNESWIPVIDTVAQHLSELLQERKAIAA